MKNALEAKIQGGGTLVAQSGRHLLLVSAQACSWGCEIECPSIWLEFSVESA